MPFSACRPLLFLLALLPPAVLAGAPVLEAPDEIAELLSPYLPDEASGIELQKLSREILSTEGYFAPQISVAQKADEWQLKIDPGTRTLITRVNVTVDGKIEAKIRDEMIAAWTLPVGQPFRQADWDRAKQQILGQLLANDFAGARLLDSEAEIDPAKASAKLTASYATGPRYRIGALRFEGLERYDPELIARYNRMVEPGDAYREDQLNALQSTLQATPYFSSVSVQLDQEALAGDDEQVDVPLLIRVRERPTHRLSFGAGFSSNTGARVEFNYHTPNLFSQAWALDAGIRLEQKKQLAYSDIFFPPDEKNRRHSLGAMTENTYIQGLRSDRNAIGGQSVRQRGSIEQRLGLQWQREYLEPDGAQASTNIALVPNIGWTWRKVDNLLDPHQGIVLQAQIGGATKALLSDQNFIRLYSRYQQFIPLGRRDTLILHGELGYTLADSRNGIPQDYLFRTGGANSVRGYPYQSLGVTEGDATVGGRYLGGFSVEATHWLDNDWGIAAFIDAGDALDSLQDIKPALGYGLGTRWRSPAGPLGVDLAYGQRINELHLHFSLAIPF
ncbi:MAG: autotransporter assembly complex protein TamA [Rhodocyclaceae bacterium]|nr:autotransporter assembly complex protein TamA [Rhodocyclaceae bacterium]